MEFQFIPLGPLSPLRALLAEPSKVIRITHGFLDATERGGQNLDPSSGDVVDKAGDEKSSRQQRIGLQRSDIDGHGLMRVGDGLGLEFFRGNAEVLREQLRGVDKAVDAAIGVMQDDEIPS